MDRIESRLDSQLRRVSPQPRRDGLAGQAPARRNRSDSPGWSRSARASATSNAASCSRAIASKNFSTPAARSSNCRRWPRLGCTTATRRRASIITGIGRIHGRETVDRRQRRDRQGRHLFSDDREEASPRAANRDRESAAVRLSGRFGRRLPADAVRDFSRSRITSGASFTTRRGCPRSAWRRSRW